MTIAYGPTETAFAYQGIAGVAFALAEGLALDLSYRYFSAGSPDVTGTMNGGAATIDSKYK